MCTPGSAILSGLGLAAGAGSAALGASAQNDVAKARYKVAHKQAQQQAAYRAAAFAALNKGISGFSLPNQSMALAAIKADQGAKLRGAVTGPPHGGMMPTLAGAPSQVNNEYARRFVEAIDAGKAHAQQLADLGAWGNLNQANNIGLNQTGRDIGIQGDFARGTADLAGLQYNAANQAGNRAMTFADILGGAGSALGAAGASGVTDGWFGGQGLPAVPTTGQANWVPR